MKSNFFAVLLLFLLITICRLTQVNADSIKIWRTFSTGIFNVCIIQDNNGLLWIGTGGEGFFFYNGRELKKVKIWEAEDPFPTIRSAFVDKEGLIWFFVQNKGLYFYNKTTYICKKCSQESGEQNSLTSNNVNWLPNNITEDKDDLVWIGTDNGLNSFDKKTGKFSQYRHNPNDPNSLSNDNIWALLVDSYGFLWIGTDDGLNCYDKKTGKFSCYKHQHGNSSSISHNHIRAIAKDKEENLWIGTKNTGIDKFHRKTNTFQNYRHDPNNPNSLSHNEIHHIMVDRFDNLWICNEGGKTGIDCFNYKKNIFKHCSYAPKDINTISSNNILYSFEDNTGIIWLTDDAGNIDKCIWEKDIFENYSYDPKDSSSISSNNITTLYEDKSRNIWVGTFRGGLCLYTKDSNFENFKPIAKDTPDLSSSSISSILDESDGRLWLGVYDASSLSLFDTTTKKIIKSFKNPYSNREPCFLTRDNEDPCIIWFASFFVGGLFKFDTTTEQFTQYKHNPADTSSVSNNSTFNIFQDENILWIGTSGDGLVKFNKKTGKCVYYKHDPKDKNSISGNVVIQSFIDSKGNFWVSTEDGGLNKFEKQTENFIHYGFNCGFPNNSTKHILEDNEGYLWISTGSSIAKFDPRIPKVIKLFSKADGLPGDQFDRIANTLKDSNGNFWFSSSGGICKFNPKEANKIEQRIPTIVLSSFKSKEGTYNEDGIRKLTNVILPWPDNSFEFTFTVLDYSDPSNNQYAYKLEGFDKDWTYIGTTRYGKYTNVPPGKYTLCLKGSNPDGVWNKEGISINITITPPFWMTWWCKGLVGLVVLFIIVAIVHLKIRAIKQKATYMRDHAIAQVTAQVAHDIRSPLAALTTALKHLKGLSEQERILIRNATVRINDIANNLLAKYKLKLADAAIFEGQKHFKAELVSSLLEHLIAEKRLQMIEKSIELVLEPDNNTHDCFVNLEPGKFKRVISNLINNASEAIETKQGSIRIILTKQDSSLVIKIVDNGKGIPEDILFKVKQGIAASNKKEGHGIGIFSAIQDIKKWNGTYDIQSKIGEGTMFIIKLPIAESPDWFQDNITLFPNTHIIVLDDDKSIHSVWQTHLSPFLEKKLITLDNIYDIPSFKAYCLPWSSQTGANLSAPNCHAKKEEGRHNIRANRALYSKNDLFLIDYEFVNTKETGLDLVEKLGLKTNAILVTSRYEEQEIRNRVKNLGIKIIPKNFAPYIPISIKIGAVTVEQSDTILIR